MASKYESYITGGDNAWGIDTETRAQTFTPSTSHTITSVKLLLYRTGVTGTITVEIKGVDINQHPTGVALCSGSKNCSAITLSDAGEWYEITLGAGAILTAATKYAICVSDSATTGTNWIFDGTSPSYAGGCGELYSGSWSSRTGEDFMFEEWGDAIISTFTSGLPCFIRS
jgi:hypothetical protein